MALIIGGLATSALGSIASAFGASEAAEASKTAAYVNSQMAKKNAKKQSERLDAMLKDKTEKLDNINTTLDRFGGGPSLQTQENLDLLRKGQNDYLRLAAGDFGAFEDQLKDIMSSTVANTFGAGSPVGAFTQLSAQNVSNLRQQGVNTGLQISSFLGGESMNMLGTEFGLLDERFERQQQIDNQELAVKTGAVQQRAEAQGIGTAAFGSALTSIGGYASTLGYGIANNAVPMFRGPVDVASSQPASARYGAPAAFQPPQTNYAGNYAGGGGGDYGGALPTTYGDLGPPPSNGDPYGYNSVLPPLPGEVPTNAVSSVSPLMEYWNAGSPYASSYNLWNSLVI